MMVGKVTGWWGSIQRCLFPEVDAARLEFEAELTNPIRKVINVLDTVQIENFIADSTTHRPVGRPPKVRAALARAFVAKAVLNLPTTRALIDRLASDIVLRRICGFESKTQVPCEATFSNAFAEFARDDLLQVVHVAMLAQHCGDALAHNISRDATAIEGREKPVVKPKLPKEAKLKKPRGRPKKGEERPKTPTRIERQPSMTLDEMLSDLPTTCDVGAKTNSQGNQEVWIGYKLHLDVADGGVPVSAILTSASVHDSQVAIPLEVMTSHRVDSLYSLMDKAYGAKGIRDFIEASGKIAVVPAKKTSKDEPALPLDPPKAERFKARTTAERANSQLKDNLGGRHVRVRGGMKVMTHLMFGVLVLTAQMLM